MVIEDITKSMSSPFTGLCYQFSLLFKSYNDIAKVTLMLGIIFQRQTCGGVRRTIILFERTLGAKEVLFSTEEVPNYCHFSRNHMVWFVSFKNTRL